MSLFLKLKRLGIHRMYAVISVSIWFYSVFQHGMRFMVYGEKVFQDGVVFVFSSPAFSWFFSYFGLISLMGIFASLPLIKANKVTHLLQALFFLCAGFFSAHVFKKRPDDITDSLLFLGSGIFLLAKSGYLHTWLSVKIASIAGVYFWLIKDAIVNDPYLMSAKAVAACLILIGAYFAFKFELQDRINKAMKPKEEKIKTLKKDNEDLGQIVQKGIELTNMLLIGEAPNGHTKT